MPGDETWIVWFLGEEAGPPAQDVGPNEALDRVQNTGVTDQVVQPWEQQMRLAAKHGLLGARTAFIRLQSAPQGHGLGRRQGRDGGVIPKLVILADGVRSERLHCAIHPRCIFSLVAA